VNFKTASIAFAVGVVAGLVLHDRLNRPSELERQQALAALQHARDSVLTLQPETVTVFDTVAGEPVVRVVREYVVRSDTVRAADTVTVYKTNIDTVWVGSGAGFKWTFAAETEAYTLLGACHANILDPALSYTTYTLDVNERALRPRRWRVYAEVGIYADRPFLAASIAINPRLLISPMVGLESVGGTLRATWGGSAMWGVL